MAEQQLPQDYYVRLQRFTEKTYRDVYPAISPDNPALSQAGRTVIITGASRGIGKVVAISFARAGASNIVLFARNAAKLEDTVSEIRKVNSSVTVEAVSGDISKDSDIERLGNVVLEKFGGADVLINLAASLNTGVMADTDVGKWWQDFEVNTRGTYALVRLFTTRLLQKGKKGYITVFVSSLINSTIPIYGSYSISKMAVARLASFVAAENEDVLITALHPGMIKTEMTDPAFYHFSQDTPELAAAVSLYLSTDKAQFLNGRYIESNWDVEELEARKEDILKRDLLKFVTKGEFGDDVKSIQ